MNVPFMDLRAQHKPIREEILAAWTDILDTCGFVGGKYVAGFEADFAKACGVEHAVACSTGTDALILGLAALGAGPGDEIIVPANTFIATAEAVSKVGATPVFVDCLPGTWNIDADAVSAAITKNTVGILGVHLYGQPFDVDAVQAVADKAGVWLMEDSAQGHLATYKGRTAGGLAIGAGFSFYPGKNLGAPGEGGAFTTNDADLAARALKFRDHGSAKKYHHELIGWNMRMPALMASALQIKLRHLPAWTAARQQAAVHYQRRIAEIAGVEAVTQAEWAEGVYHLMVVHLNDRDRVLQTLWDNNIGAGLHYPVPCHLQPAYAELGLGEGSFKHAEYNASHCLTLPMFAEITAEQIDFVCDTLAANL